MNDRGLTNFLYLAYDLFIINVSTQFQKYTCLYLQAGQGVLACMHIYAYRSMRAWLASLVR